MKVKLYCIAVSSVNTLKLVHIAHIRALTVGD